MQLSSTYLASNVVHEFLLHAEEHLGAMEPDIVPCGAVWQFPDPMCPIYSVAVGDGSWMDVVC